MPGLPILFLLLPVWSLRGPLRGIDATTARERAAKVPEGEDTRSR